MEAQWTGKIVSIQEFLANDKYIKRLSIAVGTGVLEDVGGQIHVDVPPKVAEQNSMRMNDMVRVHLSTRIRCSQGQLCHVPATYLAFDEIKWDVSFYKSFHFALVARVCDHNKTQVLLSAGGFLIVVDKSVLLSNSLLGSEARVLCCFEFLSSSREQERGDQEKKEKPSHD